MYRLLLPLIALSLFTGHALAQEREWSLDASEQEAYLIFGVADSDDVGVSLWCPAHKDVVDLFVPRPTEELQKVGRKHVALLVKAGEEAATFAGKIELSPDATMSSVEVEMPVTHPLLKAMEHADRFSIEIAGREVVFPLYDADVTGLLDNCRKG